jgi:polyisoprenoid-binding protein YceI
MFVPVLALTVQLGAGAALAKPTTFAVDPNHSRVTFSIRHIFSKVPGNFTLARGTLVFDPDAPTSGSVRADIDAASVDTANPKRDGHLRSADFFDVEKFPTITFVSKQVKDLGQGKLQVAGDLTMHGVTKPVTLEAGYLGSGPGPDGALRAGFEATTRVDRKEFGIVWNRALDQGGTLLGDDVDIRLDIEGVEQRPEEAKDSGSKPADGKGAGGKSTEKSGK